MSTDKNLLKVKAGKAKEVARQRVNAVKKAAEQAKVLKLNPPPELVSMPVQTGNAEADSTAELSAVQEGFRNRAKAEADRFALATDTEYWACLCFQSRQQKDAFLAALNILQYGDKYLDGPTVARELGVDIPAADVPYNTSGKIDKAWLEFVE